jgi:NADH-quinone oxidoreductase subunit L
VNLPFAWLCFIFPLVGVLLTPVFSRIHPKLRDYGAVFFSFLAALSAVMLLPYLFEPSQLPIESSYRWLDFPIKIGIGVLIDPLSIVLANVVAVISFFIMVYCVGYMKGDPSVGRFWMLMNLFIGSMLLLVLADNLLFLFIGWKMVGFCSYGLIGYYYRDEKKYWIGGPPPTKFAKPSDCALKALVVTGVGDMLMLAGILIMFFYAGTLNILELYQTSAVWIPEMAKSPGMILLVSILLLAGPIGKSAQFPLHEWLPEAMAGPAPVSALIHAATMVKSGVYLVARLIPIFYYGYWVAGSAEALSFFTLTAWVGAITAFLAASQGLVSLELKKVLAYSTVSQIGYMMLALGVSGFSQNILVGGYTAGIFHLLSHAMFKACLFLCSGTVIHAVHSIYMHEMGVMRKYMPYTWVFMTIAALSLMGVPPLPGFWSKDAVLVSCLESQNYFLFIIAIVTVIFTSFYTTRFIGMIFHGKASDNVKHLREERTHIGEGYLSQTFACGVLAVALVLFGIFGPRIEHLLHGTFAFNLTEQLHLPVHDAEAQFPHLFIPLLSVVSVLIGAIPAYFLYVSGKVDPKRIAERYSLISILHKFFWERWYIDSLFNRIFARGTVDLSNKVPPIIEDPWDNTIHKRLPSLITKGGYKLFMSLRTETRILNYNVGYVLVMIIVFILITVWGIKSK